jgi:hypothetical protein
MPIIQPPPPPPKMVTIAVRLKIEDLRYLKAYEAYSGSPTHSHVIVGALEFLYGNDDGFKPWFDAHPNLSTEKKARRNGNTKRPQKVETPRDGVSSAVAAEAAGSTEV